MEAQVKRAIFCELQTAARLSRHETQARNTYIGRDVTTPDDAPLPNSWGAQVTVTFTADEKSTLNPGATLKTPIAPASAFGQSVAQSFALGLGGTLSSQNIRYDRFNFYYTAQDLLRPPPSDGGICGDAIPENIRPIMGPDTHSTPFINAAGLGIRTWLPGAIFVTNFARSSRAAADGEGAPVTLGSFAADSVTYDNKFLVVTSGNITPSWNLVRVSTATMPFLDLNRTRTHELLITVGPGETKTKQNPKSGRTSIANIGPSGSAVNSHFASQIASSLAALQNR